MYIKYLLEISFQFYIFSFHNFFFLRDLSYHIYTALINFYFSFSNCTTLVFHTLKMLGCFNPTMGQIWTNQTFELILIKKITQ